MGNLSRGSSNTNITHTNSGASLLGNNYANSPRTLSFNNAVPPNLRPPPTQSSRSKSPSISPNKPPVHPYTRRDGLGTSRDSTELPEIRVISNLTRAGADLKKANKYVEASTTLDKSTSVESLRFDSRRSSGNTTSSMSALHIRVAIKSFALI